MRTGPPRSRRRPQESRFPQPSKPLSSAKRMLERAKYLSSAKWLHHATPPRKTRGHRRKVARQGQAPIPVLTESSNSLPPRHSFPGAASVPLFSYCVLFQRPSADPGTTQLLAFLFRALNGVSYPNVEAENSRERRNSLTSETLCLGR